eukprot:6183311-Pleurochrysis_carterae.AAC.2
MSMRTCEASAVARSRIRPCPAYPRRCRCHKKHYEAELKSRRTQADKRDGRVHQGQPTCVLHPAEIADAWTEVRRAKCCTRCAHRRLAGLVDGGAHRGPAVSVAEQRDLVLACGTKALLWMSVKSAQRSLRDGMRSRDARRTADKHI